jgi:hypothetical protein
MADHKDHKLAHPTLVWIEMGSADADFLHRAGEAFSFPPALLNIRSEEHFTPLLHGTLHRSLHQSAAHKARQVNQMDVPKTVGLRVAWHDVRAGATPPFDAQCVTVAVWSLPPSQELRVSVLRGCIHRTEDLSDKMSDILHKKRKEKTVVYIKVTTKTAQSSQHPSACRRIGKDSA